MKQQDDCERLGRVVHTPEGIVLQPKPKKIKRIPKPKIRDIPMWKRPIEEQKYNRYKQSAKQRDKEFDLSYEQFMEYWQKPCRYCGSPISTIGIDRIDNSKGYLIDNIDACCTKCNLMKHKTNEKDFIDQCLRITQNFKVS